MNYNIFFTFLIQLIRPGTIIIIIMIIRIIIKKIINHQNLLSSSGDKQVEREGRKFTSKLCARETIAVDRRRRIPLIPSNNKTTLKVV